MKTIINIIFFIAVLGLNLFAQGTAGSGNTGVGLDPNVQHQPFTPPTVAPGNPTDGNSGPEEAPRLVYWVHGLKGSAYSWAKASDASMRGAGAAFPARKLISITDTEYGEDVDARAAANFLGPKMYSYTPLGGPIDRNFIVAHSQGGVVTRSLAYLDYCQPNPLGTSYGGYVTFGSPHQGARIVNNAPMFDGLMLDLCAGLAEGPLKEFADSISNAKFSILGFDINFDLALDKLVNEKSVNKVCKSLTGFFAPLIRANQLPALSNDYKVGADWLETMNNCESQELADMPKMAFYGIEPEYSLMYRTTQWFLTNPNTAGFFGANDDLTMAEMFQENYLRYVDKVEEYKAKYDKEKFWYEAYECETGFKYFKPFCILSRGNMKEYKEYEEAWQRGVDILGRMDDQYKLVIGALTIDTTVVNECWVRRTGLRVQDMARGSFHM